MLRDTHQRIQVHGTLKPEEDACFLVLPHKGAHDLGVGAGDGARGDDHIAHFHRIALHRLAVDGGGMGLRLLLRRPEAGGAAVHLRLAALAVGRRHGARGIQQRHGIAVYIVPDGLHRAGENVAFKKYAAGGQPPGAVVQRRACVAAHLLRRRGHIRLGEVCAAEPEQQSLLIMSCKQL